MKGLRTEDKQELLVIKSLAGFFYDMVTSTARKLHMDLSQPVTSYLVNLLSAWTRQEYDPLKGPPLGPELMKALSESSTAKRLADLKRIGDRALYEGGYFAAKLVHSLVDVNYYRSIGRDAYSRLAGEHYQAHMKSLFRELASRFADLAGLLTEAAESGHHSPQSGLADLYERWLATGSKQLADKLRAMGVLPIKPGADS